MSSRVRQARRESNCKILNRRGRWGRPQRTRRESRLLPGASFHELAGAQARRESNCKILNRRGRWGKPQRTRREVACSEELLS
jgi:hypothetical protein